MTSNNPIENIDIELYPDIMDIIEKCYISGNLFFLKLKKPKENTIIVTVKTDYTSFRNQIEKLLKEKGLEKENIKNILTMVDNSNEIIYKDTVTAANSIIVNDFENIKVLESDQSDQSDLSDPENITTTVNVSECLKLHSGKIKVTGNIVGISEPYKVVHEIINVCGCGENPKSFTPPLFVIPKDGQRCRECDSIIKIKKTSIKYKNAITIQLQDNERFNDIEKNTCILLDINIENIRIGEKVTVKGNIHILPRSNKNLLVPMVFTEQLEYENKDEIITNEKDIEAIKRLAKLKHSSIIETLVDMFDKSIIGNNIVKESLLYGIVSTGNDLGEIRKSKTRNRINVLISGNPGLGKSSLLRKAVTLIKNSRYESIQNSSGKSLTAIVLKEDEHYFLRLGPIPIAKESICALDEIGTMAPDEQKFLLDIMEEGEFTINKYGHNSKIQAPTTIIATTNFKDSSLNFDINDKIQLSELPLEGQLLDRFDIIVIFKEDKNIKTIREYAEKKLDLQSGSIPNYDIFLQKYLEYAIKIKPFLSPEAKRMIQEYYVNLYRSNPNLESKRTLDTVSRLCKAVSKLKLKEIVDAEDVIYATSFYYSIIVNYMNSIAFIPKDPVGLIIERCIAILKESKENPIIFTDLIKKVCDDNGYIKSYLLGLNVEQVEEHKLLGLDKNKKVRKIKDILLDDKNIAAVNKNPIKIQFIEAIAHSSGADGSDGSDKVEANEIESLTLKQKILN